MMDSMTNSLAVLMALKEMAHRCWNNRRRHIDSTEDMPQGELFLKYSGSQMSCLNSSERLRMTTTIRGLLRIEVHPRRRWKWWGQHGWLVVLYLLHDQDDTWRWRRFFTNFRELCAWLGIDEDKPVWQCKRQVLAARTEDSEWVPF